MGALPFVQITAGARVGQIIQVRVTTARCGPHMFDVERAAGDEFTALTVFAAIAGALGNLPAELIGGCRSCRSSIMGCERRRQCFAPFQQIERFCLAQRQQIFLFDQLGSPVGLAG